MLSDIADIVTGKTPSTKEVSYFGGSIHFITPGDINKGLKHVYSTERTLTESGLQAIRGSAVNANAICVSCIGNIGYVGMSTMRCATNQQINTLIVKDGFDEDFVYYLIKYLWPEFKNFEGQSTTLSILNKGQFSKIQVRVPSLALQKQIAAVLSSIDDKIELNNRINHNLEEQIQERFDSMIFSDNGLGYCQMANYIDVNPKRSLRKNEPAKCVDMSYLSTTGPFPSGWETKGYNGGMKFLNGDTIMARITPCLENRKVAYVNFLDDGEVAFGSTEYIVLHAKEGVASVFTYFLARNKNFVDYATKNMNGSSGRQRVSGETIGKFMIPVIDSNTLNEFSSFATPVMEVIRNNSFESRSLAATRDALLPILLSGELSISQKKC